MSCSLQQPYIWASKEQLDFEWDFREYLTAEGDAIASFEIELGPGLERVDDRHANGIVWTMLRVTDGTPRGTATFAICRLVTTSDPERKPSRIITFVIDQT